MRKLVITLFCIALLLPSRGNTLGLGEIELHSSLNEELKAEIALLSIGQESAETIIVKLASKAEFDRAGIDRPFILSDLKFVVKVKNNKPYIEVSSKKSIREPFLSFLLDIDWPRGHILREFTLLLDPPVFMQTSAEGTPTKAVAPVSNSDEVSDQPLNRPGYEAADTTNSRASASAAFATSPQAQRPEQQTQPAAQALYREPVDGYRVQKNDTAWKIAERMIGGRNISIEQMMMALLRRNPEAFIRDNINGIKRGYILRQPDQQNIISLDNKTALIQVKEQYALWREYRQSVTAKRNANKINRADKTAAKASLSGAKGHLKITSAAEGDASEGATSGQQSPDAQLKQLRQDLAATSEELASGKLENEELKQRVSSLQSRIKKMQRLLNLKDGDLANLQSDLSPEPAQAANDAALETAAEVSPAAVEMATEEKAAVESELSPAADAIKQMPADDAVMDAVSSTQAPADAVFMDEVEEPATQQSQDMQPAATAPATPTAAVVPAEASLIDQITSGELVEKLLKEPAALPIIAGVPALALLLVLYLVIRSRRKKSENTEDTVASLLETGDFNFADVADMVEADNDFSDQTDDIGEQLEAFAEEAEINLNDDKDVISLEEDLPAEETPKDDVLAEADVYLAYGIYQQAEELLKTAVAENPDRSDYKIKLLETFYASKDKPHFTSLASDLQPQLDAESAEWQRIVAMGRELDPASDLFSGADSLQRFDIDDLLPEKPETDFDLGEAAADFDLGESIDGDEFDLDMDDDEIDATVALSAEDVAAFDMAAMPSDNTDNFALNDEGLDELDQELAAASSGDEAIEELDDAFSLDFEMADLGIDEAAAEISAEETEIVASSMAPEMEDFADKSADNAISLDNTEVFEKDLNDLSSADEVTMDDLSLDMDDVSLDMGDVSLDMGDIDLGDIDLSLDDVADSASAAPVLSQEDDEMIDISRLPDDLDEVNTKLDLARAYIDMGDSDGASSILREVIDEGAAEQKQTAESMLKDIA
ncbi:MAG: hypothetical protein OEY36_03260 [Gammaproteobacteria bacterium]|nr:hypothetical protein [Gammaproteobacteria bacterium]